MPSTDSVGFVGLGVMGEPMCRNLAEKSDVELIGYDIRPESLEHLATFGVLAAESVADVATRCDIIFLSLPAAEHVRAVCTEEAGLLTHCSAGATVIDLSTVPPSLAQDLHAKFGTRGISFADAPVARSRHAAVDGTLSIMFGGDAKVLERVHEFLACMGTDITHCGGPGTGQVVKILNNMLLFDTCVSIAETLVMGERAGVDPQLLVETLSKGSADSFALRTHAAKAMLSNDYPEDAFSVRYALKDLTYALQIADETGVDARAGQLVREYFNQAIDAGLGEQYHPVVKKLVEGSEG